MNDRLARCSRALWIVRCALTFLLLTSLASQSCHSQKAGSKMDMHVAATKFLNTLSTQQKEKTVFSFDDEERYHWNYIPMERKGIVLKELNTAQRKAAMYLLQTALSNAGYEKTMAIMQLEKILKIAENRTEDDNYRDPEKYFLSVFGNPGRDSIWGWRFEGHHVSFNFSGNTGQLISGTPGFLGTNPAVVLTGAEKGKEILKEEARIGFALLHSFDSLQKRKAIVSAKAPADIVTVASRKALIENPEGILFKELNKAQQKLLSQLLQIYLQRYPAKYATSLMMRVEKAGMNNLRFAWAGAQLPGIGNPHYYRITGPTIIIEYDNTQNNANHAHTVVRDLQYDFGGDQLLEHYKKHKHN